MSPAKHRAPAMSDLLRGVNLPPLYNTQALEVRHQVVDGHTTLLRWSGVCTAQERILMREDVPAVFVTIPLVGSPSIEMFEERSSECHVLKEGLVTLSRNFERITALHHNAQFDCLSVSVPFDKFHSMFETPLFDGETKPPSTDRFFKEAVSGRDFSLCVDAIARELSLDTSIRSGNSLWWEGQTLVFLGLLMEIFFSPGKGFLTKIRSERSALLKVRDMLLSDLSSPPTLSSLSMACGISVIRIKRGFPHHFGRTVYDLFQEERMMEARRLLRRPGASVSEVASRLGYSNFSHFSAAFRKYCGVNPSEFMSGRRARALREVDANVTS